MNTRKEETGPRLEFYESETADEYRWRVVAANGEIIAASSEGFTRAESAAANWQLLVDFIATGLKKENDEYVRQQLREQGRVSGQ